MTRFFNINRIRDFLGNSKFSSRLGVGLILLYCFLVSVFYSDFAERHVSVSFLPFPVFIGEIVLFVCFVLFLSEFRKNVALFSVKTRWVLLVYFTWVLVKSLVNYFSEGSLTFRNAALFYYPMFTVLSYVFYSRADFSRFMLVVLGAVAVWGLFFKAMIVWFWWTYAMGCVLAVLSLKSWKTRSLGFAFLAFVLLVGSEYLYKGPRAHFVSVFCSVLFLSFFLGALLVKSRRFILFGVLATVFLTFASGFLVFADRNDMSSLTSFRKLQNVLADFEVKLSRQEKDYVPQVLPVNLYNPNTSVEVVSPANLAPTPTVSVTENPKGTSPLAVSPVPVPVPLPSPSLATAVVEQNTAKEPVTDKEGFSVFNSRIRNGRGLELNENNIVFRLFIWRDMAREMIRERAVFGFSFGHPQRSRSLEILNWASGEWSRDGWITPHNSFFHIIYRSGVLGLIFIGVLFVLVGKMTQDFFRTDSVKGGLLVSVLVYWLVLSNFFIILELPHNAIIFWTLLGLTSAYRDQVCHGRKRMV